MLPASSVLTLVKEAAVAALGGTTSEWPRRTAEVVMEIWLTGGPNSVVLAPWEVNANMDSRNTEASAIDM